MTTDRRRAVAALIAAGLLWGTTVPLSKLALVWLLPGWLTFVRFGLAAAILLVVARSRVREVCTPALLASGAIGYGGSVLVQNAGIGRTSVSHAALLAGAAPVMIAVIAALWQHTVARPVAWAGFALSLAGVALVTGGGGGGATVGGDGLVLASLLLSAVFTVAQGRLLRGRDPVAVTAVQFLGAALVMLPFASVTEGMPAAPSGPGVVLTVIGLAAVGTLVPFTLFAYGQSRVSAEVAGAFVNLEPLVGAVAGVVVFGNPAGLEQVAGGTAILAGIGLSILPLLVRRHQMPGVRVVVGQPDAAAAGPGLDREALGAGGHRGEPLPGAPAAGGEVGALDLRARRLASGAAERQGEARRGSQAKRPPRAGRAEPVPPRRAVRRAGQRRRWRKAGAVVRAGHETGPRGHGHLGRRHASAEHAHRPGGTGHRPPPVRRHGCGIDPEPAAPRRLCETAGHGRDHPAAAGRDAAHQPAVQA
jgi:drug/metabolite transporter (DMT)-like permease